MMHEYAVHIIDKDQVSTVEKKPIPESVLIDSNNGRVMFMHLWQTLDFSCLRGQGLSVTIPRYYLHGIQTPEEYSNTKFSKISRILRSKGDSFLAENPPSVCAVANSESVLLALCDGHHRVRAAGVYQIDQIPCEVFSPEQISDILNKISRAHGLGLIDATALTQAIQYHLISWSSLATGLFERLQIGHKRIKLPGYMPLQRFRETVSDSIWSKHLGQGYG